MYQSSSWISSLLFSIEDSSSIFSSSIISSFLLSFSSIDSSLSSLFWSHLRSDRSIYQLSSWISSLLFSIEDSSSIFSSSIISSFLLSFSSIDLSLSSLSSSQLRSDKSIYQSSSSSKSTFQYQTLLFNSSWYWATYSPFSNKYKILFNVSQSRRQVGSFSHHTSFQISGNIDCMYPYAFINFSSNSFPR